MENKETNLENNSTSNNSNKSKGIDEQNGEIKYSIEKEKLLGVLKSSLAVDENKEFKDVRNIGVFGEYGVGKSTMIKSLYENNFKKNSKTESNDLTFLSKKMKTSNIFTRIKNKKKNNIVFKVISLGLYDDPKKHDIDADEIENKIEVSILQQLLYTVNSSELPLSKINRINKSKANKNIKNVKTILNSLVMFLLIYFLVNIFSSERISTFLPTFISNSIFSTKLSTEIQILIFFVVTVLVILQTKKLISALISLLTNIIINFRKIDVGSIKITDFEDENNNSLINTHLDELIYWFSETETRVVFFEDIDRFKNISIFSKLKELNFILNSSLDKSIIFVYCLNDMLFTNVEERSKFFDYSLRVYNHVNHLSFRDVLFEELPILKNELSNDFITEISEFISNRRQLKNIKNDYEILKEYYNNKLNNSTQEYNKTHDLTKSNEKIFSIATFYNLISLEANNYNNSVEQYILNTFSELYKMYDDLVSKEKTDLDGLRQNFNKNYEKLIDRIYKTIEENIEFYQDNYFYQSKEIPLFKVNQSIDYYDTEDGIISYDVREFLDYELSSFYYYLIEKVRINDYTFEAFCDLFDNLEKKSNTFNDSIIFYVTNKKTSRMNLGYACDPHFDKSFLTSTHDFASFIEVSENNSNGKPKYWIDEEIKKLKNEYETLKKTENILEEKENITDHFLKNYSKIISFLGKNRNNQYEKYKHNNKLIIEFISKEWIEQDFQKYILDTTKIKGDISFNELTELVSSKKRFDVNNFADDVVFKVANLYSIDSFPNTEPVYAIDLFFFLEGKLNEDMFNLDLKDYKYKNEIERIIDYNGGFPIFLKTFLRILLDSKLSNEKKSLIFTCLCSHKDFNIIKNLQYVKDEIKLKIANELKIERILEFSINVEISDSTNDFNWEIFLEFFKSNYIIKDFTTVYNYLKNKNQKIYLKSIHKYEITKYHSIYSTIKFDYGTDIFNYKEIQDEYEVDALSHIIVSRSFENNTENVLKIIEILSEENGSSLKIDIIKKLTYKKVGKYVYSFEDESLKSFLNYLKNGLSIFQQEKEKVFFDNFTNVIDDTFIMTEIPNKEDVSVNPYVYRRIYYNDITSLKEL